MTSNTSAGRGAGGDAAAGTHAIRDSLELADGTGMRMLQPLHRRLLSDALRRWLDAAVETADRQGAVVARDRAECAGGPTACGDTGAGIGVRCGGPAGTLMGVPSVGRRCAFDGRAARTAMVSLRGDRLGAPCQATARRIARVPTYRPTHATPTAAITPPPTVAEIISPLNSARSASTT